MSRFDSMGAAYLGPSLIHHHGEPVTVHPYGSPSYEIFAIVDREPEDQDVLGSSAPSAIVEVLDDATGGIAINDLNRGTYEIEFAMERPGGTTARHKVLDFERPVGGMITLYIQ